MRRLSLRAGLAPTLIGLGAAGSVGCGSGEASPEPLRVAVVAPMPETGPLAEARRGWQLVAEDINRRGGVAGRELVVQELATPLSHPSDLSPIVEGFEALSTTGVGYAISLVAGDVVEPIMRAALEGELLTMSVAAEDSRRNRPEYGGTLLRAVLPTDRLIARLATALRERGATRACLVGPETDDGRVDERHQAMQRAWVACDDCVSVDVTYPASADAWTYDWTELGQRVASAQPDVVFLTATDPQALIDGIYSSEAAGYSGQYYFAYGAFMSAIAGVFPGSDVESRLRASDLGLPSGDARDRFEALYQERYDELPTPEPRLVAFADFVALLSLSVSRVGAAPASRLASEMRRLANPPGEVFGPLDLPEALRALDEGREINFEGFSGSLDFGELGDVSDGLIVEYGLDESGRVVPL